MATKQANETADDYANRILSNVDLDVSPKPPTMAEISGLLMDRNELLRALKKVVNGATRTMGRNSIDQDYAHISQDVLDVGREALLKFGVKNVSERS